MTAPLRVLSPLHRATRQVGLALEGAMAEMGLANGEAHVLAYLARYGPCRIGELHRVFGLKRSTLTSLLDRLEARGACRRALDPDDRRSFQVSLTAEGATRAARVARVLEAFERRLLARIPGRDLEGFHAVMRAIGEATGITVRPAPVRSDQGGRP